MKKLILILLAVCLSIPFTIQAQTNYYTLKNGTITGSGFTYKYDCSGSLTNSPGAWVTLYSAASRFTYAEMTYRDGSEIDFIALMNQGISSWDQIDGMRAAAEAIINGAFTATEKARINGDEIMITMIISPDTGAVIEVYFEFINDSAYALVPPATYRKIEVGLMRDIRFIPTETGRKFNYIMCAWMHAVV